MSREQELDRQGIGKWMMALFWVLLLGMMSLLFSGLLERQYNPNSMPETARTGPGQAQVTLVQNRAGHYVATGFINDHQVRFLLDTGATDVACRENLLNNCSSPKDHPRSVAQPTAM